MAKRTKSKELSDLLSDYAKDEAGDHVSLGDLNKLLGSRSIAGLLLVLALPIALPIPMPGISLVLGALLILISGQLAIGLTRCWLPPFLAERRLTKKQFSSLLEKVLPTLKKFERIVRPRMVYLVRGWMRIPIGILCVFLALIVTLPIPFGNVMPCIAIAFLALGLLQHDGLVVGIGFGAATGAFILILGAWTSVKLLIPF
jgi:hypothetical protein